MEETESTLIKTELKRCSSKMLHLEAIGYARSPESPVTVLHVETIAFKPTVSSSVAFAPGQIHGLPYASSLKVSVQNVDELIPFRSASISSL